MKYITCLKCKIKYKELHNVCKKYKLKDKFKEEYNEECYLKVIDEELSKAINSYHEDLFNSLASVDDFMNDSKSCEVYKIED